MPVNAGAIPVASELQLAPFASETATFPNSVLVTTKRLLLYATLVRLHITLIGFASSVHVLVSFTAEVKI